VVVDGHAEILWRSGVDEQHVRQELGEVVGVELGVVAMGCDQQVGPAVERAPRAVRFEAGGGGPWLSTTPSTNVLLAPASRSRCSTWTA
jgi:hypothetical protein